MQVRRKSKWRKKNARRARRRLERSPASIAWSAETRRLKRAAFAAQSEAALLAEAAEPNVPPPPAPKPDHVLDVRVRIDGDERTFRAVCINGEWIGDSGNRMTRAIRLVMAAGVRA